LTRNAAASKGRLGRYVTWATAALLLVLVQLVPAGAHEIKYFWQYEPRLFRPTHTWKSHPELRQWHKEWHQRNPHVSEERHLRFHHRKIDHAHQDLHHHAVLKTEQGQASWYDLEGRMGACGLPLTGLYAAHPSWKCGGLVSVRAGDRWVFVTVLDRGPHLDGRVIDLSKEAFSRLAAPAEGVIDVKLYRVER
jgi:rare lipoprotein A